MNFVGMMEVTQFNVSIIHEHRIWRSAAHVTGFGDPLHMSPDLEIRCTSATTHKHPSQL